MMLSDVYLTDVCSVHRT